MLQGQEDRFLDHYLGGLFLGSLLVGAAIIYLVRKSEAQQDRVEQVLEPENRSVTRETGGPQGPVEGLAPGIKPFTQESESQQDPIEEISEAEITAFIRESVAPDSFEHAHNDRFVRNAVRGVLQHKAWERSRKDGPRSASPAPEGR